MVPRSPKASTFAYVEHMARLAHAARGMRVTAASLAVAGLLGACAGPQGPAQQAQATPAAPAQPVAKADGKAAGGERTFVISALKDAESAFSEYARARNTEASLREAAQAAANATLVARHRQSIGADFALVMQAEQRQVQLEEQLRASEAATRVAREKLARALGFSGNTASEKQRRTDGSGGASTMPVGAPAGLAEGSVTPLTTVPRNASSRLL